MVIKYMDIEKLNEANDLLFKIDEYRYMIDQLNDPKSMFAKLDNTTREMLIHNFEVIITNCKKLFDTL